MNNIIIKNLFFKTYFYEEVEKMYEIFCKENFDSDIKIIDGFEPLIKVLYSKHNQTLKNIITYNLNNDFHVNNNNNNKILIGYSGGLDSAYLALKLRDNGYDVTLFHLKGLNKSYPKEDLFAKEFADNMKFNYVELEIKYNSKQFFIDNPLKNQLILSLMIDYGINNNICNFGLGADWCTSIEDAKIGMTVTDSIEVNKLYWDGIKKYFPEANLIFIDSDTKKYERLKYLCDEHNNSLQYIYSCVSPNRFNKQLHDLNENKFNIKLLNGRCGSCYKCCMEILLLTKIGYYSYNEELVNHCWKILSDSKNSHRKDLFDKKISLEVREKNLLEYGS